MVGVEAIFTKNIAKYGDLATDRELLINSLICCYKQHLRDCKTIVKD